MSCRDAVLKTVTNADRPIVPPTCWQTFSIADAMFAPVVTRFRTYKIDLEREADAYCDTIMAMPAMQEWVAAAKNEPMIVEAFEF